MNRPTLIALTSLGLAACASPATDLPEPAEAPWVFSDNAASLRASSCPDGVSYDRAGALQMSATSIELGERLDAETHLPQASFVGGWHLTSDDPNFGGLSGLDSFPSGNLLAVTDEGAFVWINMDEAGAPASAHIAYMRGVDGQFIAGKGEKDAEGLSLSEGLALVSFERNHRVVAFDLEGCGTNARAADLAQLGDRISGMTRDMEENGGAEGLSIQPETGELLLGIETTDVGKPLAQLMDNRVASIVTQLADGRAPRITGIDHLGEQLFVVRRDFQPGYGNTIVVQRMQRGYTETLIHLDPDVTVDNFEGIAAVETETGIRLWLVSDNNFSKTQRTLLFAFDVEL